MILTKILLLFFAILVSIHAQDSHTYHPRQRKRGHHLENKMVFNDSPSKERVDARNDGYRLPATVDPISYFVRLQPFVNGDQTVTGYIEILFEATEATSNLTLHMQDISYDEASVLVEVVDGGTDTITVTSHSYDSETHLYVGTLAEPLANATQYRISMNFQGVIASGFDGFYQSTYIDEDGQEVRLATTQFQPVHARMAFPCFDEPALKATFQVEMGREDMHVVLTNTPWLSSRPIDGFEGWTWDLFGVSPIMSSYLVAFVISDFVSISANSSTGTIFNTWSRSEIIQFGDYSLEVSPGISSFFEEYFDYAYPLPKQDQIAIPDFSAGAMENWGLITYREELLLWNPLLSTTHDKLNVVQVIAHELAHMWFGNLVTAEWWSDLWLNEGFASYYEYVGTEAVEPDMDIMIDFVYGTLQAVFESDANELSEPVVYDVETPGEIGSMFNVNTYSKGGSLVRMMEHFLTHDTFVTGLQLYLKDREYGNAFQQDLFHDLSNQAHLDGVLDESMAVHYIMDTWTLQPGYPLITVQVNGDGTATLTQERYLNVPNPNATALTYWVPISFASDTINTIFDSYPVAWMSPTDTQITISGLSPSSPWHIFNVQQAMYYRVNYDDTTWNGIAAQLVADYSVIDTRNRAQAIDDSFVLAEAGILSFEIAFNIGTYLNDEPHYVPWKAILYRIAYIEEMFSRTTAYTGLTEYLLNGLMPAYDSVGAVDNVDDPDRTLFLRDVIMPWACDMEYQPCLTSASAQFTQWMATPDDYTIISPNLKPSIYCTAVQEGDSVEWDFSLNRYQTTESAEEASQLLFAMACSQDEITINGYLDMIYNGEGAIDESDATSAFNNIAGTDFGRDLAWSYLVANYHAIAAFYDSYLTVQQLASGASREFNTEEELAELVAFRDLLAQEGTTVVIDAAILRVENNIQWMNTNYDTIAGWLSNNGYGL